MIDPARPSDVGNLTDVVGRLRRTLRRSVRTEYPWEQLPMARVELLHALSELGGSARVGELATARRLAPNTVSELAQQLVDDGFADRHPDPHDRRASLITLTELGSAQLRRWTQANDARILMAVQALTTSDRASISRAVPALQRLVEELEKQDARVRS